jgi:translation initiation factor IF-2
MLKKILEGLLEPEYEEVVTGEAEVKQIFWTKGKTRIIGCKVNKGYLENGEKLKVLRADEEIGQGKIAVLQHFEKKVPKIEENQECGIQLEGLKEEIQEGDILHGVKEEKKIKTL